MEVYEQSAQIVPGHRSSAELYLEDIPPRQLLVSQFVFDVPIDVEPELLVVTEEPQMGTVLDVGVVDLRDEEPQGPRPEEILALQYEYGNMENWERAYQLFAQESKDRVSLQQYESAWENTNPETVTQCSFPSVEIEGDRATIERVITSETSEGEGQFKDTQEAVLEDDGWRIVMRDEQVEFFLGGGEATTG